MRRIALITVLALGFCGTAQAWRWGQQRPIPPPCDSIVLTATSQQPGRATIRCEASTTIHVTVGRTQLLIADLSHNSSTATFYGNGAVVRAVQRHGHVRVLAETVDRKAHIRVWFTRN